jgi:hypothetical protein
MGYSEEPTCHWRQNDVDPPNCSGDNCIYGRKHVPWISFASIPKGANGWNFVHLRFAGFPSDYATLPTVAFVISNLNHDMHNGKPAQSIPPRDAWLRANLGGYYQWAKTHNSLLIAAFSSLPSTRTMPRISILAHHRSDAWAAKVGRRSGQIVPEAGIADETIVTDVFEPLP